MPSGKGRSKEDTWKESDLKKAIQGDKKDRSSRREDDRRERRSDRDDDRRRRERREDLVNGEDKDREQRRKERSSDKERRRDRDRDGDKPRERSDRDKERRREHEGESSGKERREKERSNRDKESSRDRERQRERDGESSGKDRRERDKRERDLGESEGQRRDKDRESDKDREQRQRSRREPESGDLHRNDRKAREKDDEIGSDDRRKDRERRKRREEGESSRHDENKDQKRERSREQDHRGRRKEKDHDESRRHGEKSGERRDKRRERDDRERRKEKEEHDTDKENRVKLRERKMVVSSRDEEEEPSSKGESSKGKRFRADTLEEADVVDEEENVKGRKGQNAMDQKSSILKADEVNDEEAYDYEEDFEDYEDDFENEQDDEEEINIPLGDRNAGMQELLKAINLENETVTLSREGSKMSRSSDDDSRREAPIRPVTAKGRINFVAAKQKQISEKVASRTRKRGQELMHLIDLDVVVFEMFDLPPMNEYELYIKNFGRSDTKQAYVQCNDDNLEKEIQTEEIETRTMWTQNPAEDFAGCGDERGSKEDTSSYNHATIDSVRLTRFLRTAGQACLVLLEEESADQSSKIVKDKKEMTCSDGYIPLATKQPYLAGRVLECLHVSPVQSQLVLTAYGPVTEHEKASHQVSDSLKTKSIICLWNVNEPSAPQKILVCESIPRSCCLSPSKATIAFAGLEDGSVVAWDMRESPTNHHSYNIDDDQVTFRSPTFSTAGVLSQDNHHSPVVSLLPVVMPGDSAKASTSLGGSLSDDMLGLSFQLASLEEDAVINIWVVVELDVADIAGSESDLGLAPGGKIKLIKSASLPLESPFRGVRRNSALRTYAMRFLPQDPNHFYIGTDNGFVLHRVRHGGRAPPKTYGPQIECLVDVTAVDVSPWQLPCILAGSRDGSIRLYNLNNELPLNTWTHSTEGSCVLSIQWSNSIPSVFYVLDANSTLYIWDLLKNDSEPIATEKVRQGSVVSFELSSDYSATGVGVPGRTAELILGYKNGSVEVHKINARFSKASPDELDRFHEYLEGGL